MPKQSIKDFDPGRVAALDTQLLRAYYSHNFVKLFILLIRLFKEEFGVNFLVPLRLAYLSARAAVVFRKTEDLPRTELYLTKFYSLLDKHSTESIDAVQSAKTELHWWLVHRYPKRYDETLAEATSAAKATLYSVTPQSLEQFGQYYIAATNIRDKATHVDHVEPNWQAIHKNLELAYSVLPHRPQQLGGKLLASLVEHINCHIHDGRYHLPDVQGWAY